MSNTTYSLSECVAEFNRRSPRPRDKRTVQRFLNACGVAGFGSSRHNWFYDGPSVDAAIEAAFPFAQPKRRRAA